jgi:RNA polymerase sigma-70 factor (ECF subfamily)
MGDTEEAEDESEVDKEYRSGKLFKQVDQTVLVELIRGIVKQDQAAFAELFKLLSNRVYSLSLRITRNSQLAEEVTEDVFYQVWRQAPRYDSQRGPVIAWILTMARSRALDAWRAIPPFEAEEDREMDKRYNTGDTDYGEELLLASEQNRILHEALLTLEPLPRQLISLSFFRGLSHEEISFQTSLPLGTVKSHLRRAMIRLRDNLNASTYYSPSL